ncbi:hypothetical protein GCM10010399_74580 [Dactylosporangium fulvum]|uniref:DUF304 domain-containing protein n=1 Tax=Dactylosporangium fulvum TaxID=53359 RepID=A0ABY5VPM0_9ACTN|nr:hypothetical protein [Dactylosporangium fulvum]UWP79122.1 hypothetical protein Dfulv_28595 [Dactylosporangium fulvum]
MAQDDPPLVLRRSRVLHRTHTGPIVLLAFFITIAVLGVERFAVLTRSEGLPDFLAALSTGLGWLWAVTAGSATVSAIVLVLAERRWLTGRTELTGSGVVLRSGDRATTVGWLDIEELRAVPARGGHLYKLRTGTGPLPRGAGLGLQAGGREAWLGWLSGSDAPVAALARPRLGIKYRAPR